MEIISLVEMITLIFKPKWVFVLNVNELVVCFFVNILWFWIWSFFNMRLSCWEMCECLLRETNFFFSCFSDFWNWLWRWSRCCWLPIFLNILLLFFVFNFFNCALSSFFIIPIFLNIFVKISCVPNISTFVLFIKIFFIIFNSFFNFVQCLLLLSLKTVKSLCSSFISEFFIKLVNFVDISKNMGLGII